MKLLGTMAIGMMLLVALPTAAQEWATYQCTDTSQGFCDVRFLARPAVADDLRAHCPEHDPGAFLQHYSAILVIVQDRYAGARRWFYTIISSKTHRTTEDPGFQLDNGAFVRPLWDDPTLAVRFPCYVQKLIAPHLRPQGFTFTATSAVFLVPLPTTSGCGTLILPFVIVLAPYPGTLHTVRLSLVLP